MKRHPKNILPSISLGFVPLIYGMLFSIRALGGPVIPLPQIINVFFSLIILCYCVYDRPFTVNKTLIVYFFYLGFSLLIASPPGVFHSWERLIYFITILLLISPVFHNDKLIYFRRKALKAITVIYVLLTIGSFIAFFLGINLMRNDGELDLEVAGHFGGLTCQSMMLGPIAAVSACVSLFLALRTKNKLLWLLCTVSICTIMFSASRGALLAAVMGTLVIIYYHAANKYKFVKNIILVVVTICITFPLWSGLASGIIQKNQDINREGVFDSRTTKFLARLSEFQERPITGYGFAAIDINGMDEYDAETGTIEPGSSWLAVLSMTGIIGLLMWLTINAIVIVKLSRTKFFYKSLLLSLLVLFLTHMAIEGYVFSVSTPLCVCYWLLLGVASDYSTQNNI